MSTVSATEPTGICGHARARARAFMVGLDSDSPVAVPHSEFGDEPTYGIESSSVYCAAKRAFDTVFSTAVLVDQSPLLLVIAAAIKHDDLEGPVMFFGWGIIGQKSRAATSNASRPVFSAVEVPFSREYHLRLGVAA